MIIHRTDANDTNAKPPRTMAENRKKYEKIGNSVKQQIAVSGSLINVNDLHARDTNHLYFVKDLTKPRMFAR